MVINIFNSDNSNTTEIMTKYTPIVTNIANEILKFKSIVKKPIVTNHTFFTVITFCNINSIVIQYLKISKTNQSQKYCHQDNLPFLCL